MTNNMIITNVEMYALLHYMLVYLVYDAAELRGILDLETKRKEIEVSVAVAAIFGTKQCNHSTTHIHIPYFLEKTPRLLFISALLQCDVYSRGSI